jgi:hypothetical protein
MPTGKNWLNFVYINIGFCLLIVCIILLQEIAKIKENWPIYRCNPIYMPLADNINENFVYCIQNMQTDYLAYLLEAPMHIVNTLGSTIGGIVGQIDAIRAMFSKLRDFIPNIFTNLFASFAVLIIEFQKIGIGIKDILGKITGTIVGVMYILEGSITTMQSGYNFVRGIGKCFHPSTHVLLKNGDIKAMKDLDLGDVLSNGSVVESVMKIDNKRDQIPFYVVKGAGVNKEDIYVTGSHFVYDNISSKFIKVEEYEKAELTDIKYDWFSCLITNDHKIPLGSELFWDWEDYLLRMKMV